MAAGKIYLSMFTENHYLVVVLVNESVHNMIYILSVLLVQFSKLIERDMLS